VSVVERGGTVTNGGRVFKLTEMLENLDRAYLLAGKTKFKTFWPSQQLALLA